MTAVEKKTDIVRLKENIWQLCGPKATGGCKVYLVRGTKKNLLIDAGLPTDGAAIAEQLASVGLSPGDINMIVLTHEHCDHVGGVPAFSQKTIVATHTMAANKIGLQDEFVLMSKAFGLTVEDFHIDIHLHHGTLIDVGGCVLQVLHTPGHCSGAVCLYEPDQQILFTGDTIFANGTLGGIFPSGNISDYIGTLQQLSRLRVREIFPGHGRVSTDPPHDFERAIKGSISLMQDTRLLFNALDSRSEFSHIMKSIADYSRRV
ncbi:MAG TPA: MBL fold metallo-hydrolase [Candidatus Deferrimicrobiaceae bacterium]